MDKNLSLLDPKSDYIFKLIFGKEVNKNVLFALINSCLRGKIRMVDLELTNTEIPKFEKDGRSMRLDIRAKTSDNRWLIVEMQSRNTRDIPERDVQYHASTLVENFKIIDSDGNDISDEMRNYLYPKVISIWFLAENITNRRGYIHDAFMTYEETELDPYERTTDKVHSIYIELPKFNEKLRDKTNLLQSFLTFLKDLLEIDEKDGKIVSQAYDTLKKVSADSKVRRIYQMRQDTDASIISERNIFAQKARKEGEKIGIEKGKAEEREKAHQEKIESARKMIKKGLDLADIAEFTGLSMKELQNLA